MSGDKQCDRCGNFISWGGTYYEVCEVTGSHSSITHDLCEACGTQLEAWIEQAPPRASAHREGA